MIYRKDTTDSTNRDARAGHPGDVFTAEYQTAGRGRLDHTWQSARAENLMFSIVLDVCGRPPADVATLPLIVGLALVQTLNAQFPILDSQFRLKWPNDVLVDGRKVCGILCERTGEHVIAGVGVNVNQTRFPSDIAERATSLAQLTGRTIDREALLQEMIDGILVHHARWASDGFTSLVTDYAAYDILKGREVSVSATDGDDTPVTGLCGGVQADGALLVGETRVYAGEAHVREIL